MSPSDAAVPHPVECHPFEPFLPEGARLLMLGTFPPARRRWCVDFYYPNFTNDMWRIVGHCYFADKLHFVDVQQRTYRLQALRDFLTREGVALYDTATRVIRTRNTASDKDLHVVSPTDLGALLRRLPHCRAVVTAGQLATSLACSHFQVAEPRVGNYVDVGFESRSLRLYRMPSSSRAYPMPVEQKAKAYQVVFDFIRSTD